MTSLLAWLWRHRWPIGVTLIALGLRLAYNLAIHPPEDHVFSDMGGYVRRAERLVDIPLERRPDEAFYPVGTHYFIALWLALFGSLRAASVALAVVSSLGAPLAYFLAGRLHGGARWSASAHGGDAAPREGDAPNERLAMASTTARVAGIFIAIYFPLIGYAGFFLSETLFAILLTASALVALRLADHGRDRDAWALGVIYALGLIVRPQIAIAAGLVLAWVAWRREDFPQLRPGHLVRVAIPVTLAVCYTLMISAYHTGRATPVAQNGGINRAFGRCHAYEIRSYHSMFGPPAFGALHRRERRDPDSLLPLAPAIAPKLRTRGYVWDEAEMNALADRCVQQGGLARQGYYASSHVALLWLFNTGWPDMGPFPVRGFLRGWTVAHLAIFVLPMIVAMVLGTRPRHARLGLVSLYAWSMFLTVMLVMGSVRFRVPYDIITVTLALHVYAMAASRLTSWWDRRRGGPSEENT